MTKLAGMQNAATDLEGKTDRMQTDIDIPRNDHCVLSSRIEDHSEQLRELRSGFSAVAFEATDVKLTVRKCELSLEAERGRLGEVVATNARLSDAAMTSQERADLQDRHIVELNRRIGDLRTAAERHEAALGRVKVLTYAMLVAFVAFFALLFAY